MIDPTHPLFFIFSFVLRTLVSLELASNFLICVFCVGLAAEPLPEQFSRPADLEMRPISEFQHALFTKEAVALGAFVSQYPAVVEPRSVRIRPTMCMRHLTVLL